MEDSDEDDELLLCGYVYSYLLVQYLDDCEL